MTKKKIDMGRNKFDLEGMSRENRYKVPDGYFSDLNHRIMDRVARETASEEIGFGTVIRRLSGFAIGLSCMALLAVTGFYFTGSDAGQTEELSSTEYLMSMYDVTEYDILDVEEADRLSEENFAENVFAYLDTYGYGDYDIESLINTVN